MRLLSRDGIAGLAEDDGVTGCIDLSLLPDARPGDWILVFLGTGREVLDEGEATRIKAALAGLRAIMGGGEAGDAFADLEMRTPTLPPHLQAAVKAGRTTG